MKPDYVLEAMLELLGLSVSKENVLFIPEDGAYSGGGHSHGDDSHDEHSHDKANDGGHHHHH
jgi:urease accessory protein